MDSLRFNKRFEIRDAPKDWALVRCAVDWEGNPLLLMSEGKPPEPDFYVDPNKWSKWYRTPPRAHHLIYWDGDSQKSIRFDQSQGISTSHVQPLAEGWLLADGRGGRATVHDMEGRLQATLDLGDASEDIQTAKDGHIWVSYFDEGVFGGGIGQHGLVCFDRTGTPVFRFDELAARQGLPMICDCYAMNVSPDGDIWINYYMDFPLVHLQDFNVKYSWPNFGSVGTAFAVRGSEILYLQQGVIKIAKVNSADAPETVSMMDESGKLLTSDLEFKTRLAARGQHLVYATTEAIYQLPMSPIPK